MIVAWFSKRSLNMIEKIRFVSAWTLRTSASCSRVVIPGLSDMKSLPCRIARTASGARSSGMAAVSTSLTFGSCRTSSSVRAARAWGYCLRNAVQQVRFLGVDPGQRAAGAQHRVDLRVDVVVVEADDGEVEQRVLGLA